METPTQNTIHNQDQLVAFRRVWTINLSSKKWKRIRRELELLEGLPKRDEIDQRSISRLYKRRWLSRNVSLSAITLELLTKLLGAFVASPHFLTICNRFDLDRGEGLRKLGVAACLPLMAFWTNRQFPRIHRALFRGELKRHFNLFRDIPLLEFFNYMPLFALFRLTMVLSDGKTANWIRWIITGRNLRQIPNLPFPLTRMMAHWTIQAPHYLSFEEALFYGRVRGLGGSVKLHDRLRSCFNQFHLFDDSFKGELLPFLVRHQNRVDLRELPALLGYLHHRYFENRQTDTFQLTSYSLPRLQREMGEWYTTVESHRNYESRFHGLFWTGSGYSGYENQMEKGAYQIIELRTYKDLCIEGKRLRHCVATYVEDCVEGRCSIWSLRKHVGEEEEQSFVTIEVGTEEYIEQALGKHNAKPRPEHFSVIKKWAKQEGLKFRIY
ncbi:MAG: PcfJ domain-containing protein [Saprospiraceae bacterium]|nr:PcfJ domain-containing protein [Saprospiraceae bacterium]